MKALKKFREGENYFARFIGAGDVHAIFFVQKISGKFIHLVEQGTGKERAKIIKINSAGIEYVYPFGHYSFAPCLRATQHHREEANTHPEIIKTHFCPDPGEIDSDFFCMNENI